MSRKLATAGPDECHVLAWNSFINEMDEQHVRIEKRFQQANVADVYEGCIPYARKDFIAVASKYNGILAIGILDKPQLWNDFTFAIKRLMLSRILKKEPSEGYHLYRPDPTHRCGSNGFRELKTP